MTTDNQLPPLVFPASAHKQRPRRQRRPNRGWNISDRNGRFIAVVSHPHTGERKAKTFDSKSEAEAWAETTRAKFQLSQAQARATPFEHIVKEYLVDLNRRSRSKLHIDTVTSFINQAKAAGMTDLAAANTVPLMNQILTELKTRTGKPASTKTRNNFLARMRGVANFAVQRELLYVNPFIRIGYQKVVKRIKGVFTLDEIGKLVDPANRDHAFFKAFCCLIYTGLRQREVRFMQWEWFAWGAMRIQMILDKRATMTLTSEEAKDVFIPKNGSARIVRLMEELIETMKPDGQMTGPVFPELRKLDTNGFQRRFDEYVAHCGVTIGDRTPHSCRHTWTCLMLASGENQIMVQRWAGHAEADMTGHYAMQQDSYLARVTKAGWPRGELRLRDFSPGGRCYGDPSLSKTIAMSPS